MHGVVRIRKRNLKDSIIRAEDHLRDGIGPHHRNLVKTVRPCNSPVSISEAWRDAKEDAMQ
jgi:hypothetical protein